MHNVEKRIVYMLRSDRDPSRHYVGITNDLRSRLEWHNHGPCGHTQAHRPWSLMVSMEFATERDAVAFEKTSSPDPAVRSRSGTSARSVYSGRMGNSSFRAHK